MLFLFVCFVGGSEESKVVDVESPSRSYAKRDESFYRTEGCIHEHFVNGGSTVLGLITLFQ